MIQKILINIFIILTLVSCNMDIGATDFSKKVISLINYNENFESKYQLNVNVLDDSKLILSKIILGNCSTQIIDTDHVPLLLMLVNNDKYSKEDAKLVYNCIKENGFSQSSHYGDILRLLAQKKVELMYQSLFSGFIPQDDQIFGLVEFAKLHCAKDFILFLESNQYPSNAKELMTESEYAYFDEYILKRCQ